MNVNKTETGYQIMFELETVIKNAHLSCEAMDGFLANNYFNPLPGKQESVSKTLKRFIL